MNCELHALWLHENPRGKRSNIIYILIIINHNYCRIYLNTGKKKEKKNEKNELSIIIWWDDRVTTVNVAQTFDVSQKRHYQERRITEVYQASHL